MNIKTLKAAGSIAAAIALLGCALPQEAPKNLPAGDTIETAGTDEIIPIEGFDPQYVVIDNLQFFDGTAGPLNLKLYAPELGPLYVLDSETSEEFAVMGESWIFDRIKSISWKPSQSADDRPEIEIRAMFYVGAGPTAAQPFEVGYRLVSKSVNYFVVEEIEQ